MIGLLQRVSSASVTVAGEQVAAIGPGLLVLVGVEPDDTPDHAERLLRRVLNYRVFADIADKMNCSLLDVAGDLLLVPQFTLAADTQKGSRPSFSTAANPELAAGLFDHLLSLARQSSLPLVASGVFGADMQLALVNQGPVTFWLQV